MQKGQMMNMPLTIGSLIDHAARYHGGTEIVSIHENGHRNSKTWLDIGHNARRLASALNRLGISMGDRCGTLSWNHARHLEIYFGISSAGMVCHTINPRLSADQLIYIINHAADRILFIDNSFVPLIASLRDRLKTVEHWVVLGPVEGETHASIPQVISYEELVAVGDQNFVWPHHDENLASSLCYTSGTTGNPKGVLYSHRSTVLHSFAISLPDAIGISARDTILPAVPMFHVNAWGVPYAAAMNGARLVMPGSKLNGDSLVRLIDSEKVTLALGVPTIWQGLITAAENCGSRLESLERTVIGGAACPPSMIEIFRERFKVDAIHGWGMTEMSPVGTINQPLAKHGFLPTEELNKIRLSQGRPLYGVEMKTTDSQGRKLPADGKTQGNLLVRGPWIATSYYEDDGEIPLIDGWFLTGDVATLDNDGFMNIRDRLRDIIKSGGEWISSVELENIAIGSPDLVDVAVIGVHHEKWGERPVLIAVAHENSEPDPSEILEFFCGKVAKWQVPDKVLFVDELPRTSTGKIHKVSLRDTFGHVLMDGKG